MKPHSLPPQTPTNLHQNTTDPDARWLVQEFGETSVGKFAVKVARDVVRLVSLLPSHVITLRRLRSLETAQTTIRSWSCVPLDLVPQKLWEGGFGSLM